MHPRLPGPDVEATARHSSVAHLEGALFLATATTIGRLSDSARLRRVTVYYDNPAGRLHRVLVGLRGPQPHVGIREAWAQVVHADVNEPMQLERRVLIAVQLPARAMSVMDNIPDDDSFDREFVTRWFPSVQNAFKHSFFSAGQVQHITMHYGDGTLRELESCSYILHRFRREPMPSNDDLSGITAQINELRESLRTSSDLAEDLRVLLLTHASAMAQAIDDFEVAGSEALQARLDEAIGALARKGYYKQVKEAGEAEEDSPAKKFWQILGRIALALSVTNSFLQLGHTIYRELEARPASTPHVTEVLSSSVRD